MKKMVCMLVLVSLVPVASWAYGNDRGGDRKPTTEMIEACVDKEVGDKVELTGRRGVLSATCEESDGQLVAVPERKRGGRG